MDIVELTEKLNEFSAEAFLEIVNTVVRILWIQCAGYTFKIIGLRSPFPAILNHRAVQRKRGAEVRQDFLCIHIDVIDMFALLDDEFRAQFDFPQSLIIPHQLRDLLIQRHNLFLIFSEALSVDQLSLLTNKLFAQNFQMT